MKPRFCLIGAGSIGALKPDNIDGPDTENILTHAHALKALEYDIEFNLIIDPCKEALTNACKKWGIETGYLDVKYVKEYMDVFVLAAPTEKHFQILRKIIPKRPKIIVVEKPFCNNAEEAIEVYKLARQFEVRILVNYSRRFVPEYKNLKNALSSQTIQSARLVYTRGLKREACHALDLFNWWFDGFISGQILGHGINDYSRKDITYSAFLRYKNCKEVFLNAVDGRNFGIFEIDIMTEKYRFTLVDNGRKIKNITAKKEEVYGNYLSMPSDCFSDTNPVLEDALMNMYRHVLEKLRDKGKCHPNEKDAIKVHEVISILTKRG